MQHVTPQGTVSLKANSSLSLKSILALAVVCLFTAQTYAQGTWTALSHLSPHPNNGVMILMSDGSVLCHTTSGGNLGDGTVWDKLTPDSLGGYINGTWTSIAPMISERYSFSSAVLKDGRLYAAGGEYGTDGTQAGYHAETYNPVTNSWTAATGTTSANVISDGSCMILENGNMLQGLVDVPFPVHTVVYNATSNAFSAGPSSLHGSNESVWLKLPDNSILFVDENARTSERYIPSLNQWVADGTVPVSLYDAYGYECGPGWMLPDGRAFFIGGTNHTAFYTPSGTNAPGTWTAGPDVPNGYGMPDAPGAMMVNGNILFACSPQPTQSTEFATPTKFYEFNYLTNTFIAVAAPSSAATNAISQQYNMLDLPNGQVLLGMDQDNSSSQYYIYTPTGSPLAAGKPVITGINRLSCTTYMITGHGFNGISAGTAFGDENENDSNYPLFRFKSGNRIYYARSYNWNSTGVQRGLKNDTAYLTLPATMSPGSYYMYAVANGIASDSTLFVDSVASLSSPLAPPAVCTGTPFTYTATSSTSGATFSWTRPAVTGISNAAITTAQTTNPNEVLINTTSAPITVTYAYSISGGGCTNTANVLVTVNPKPTAAFSAPVTAACALPDTVNFVNTTLAGTTYTWYFGDGLNSTAFAPAHIYNAAGTYTVKLVTSSACGIDSVTHVGLIAITPPAAPTAVSPVNINCGGIATLVATGTDSIKWFNQATGGTALFTGHTYVTGPLSANTTYYAQSTVTPAPSFCPPLINTFGTGSNFTGTNFRGEVFNVNQPCTLVSVLVVSAAAGNRTIQLTDSVGNVLQSATVNIPNGTSTVTLNFPLTPGSSYQLGCGDNSTATNLYRNITGAAFPYNDPSGYVTITGNNVPDAVHYYYFYNWKLQGPACISARTPVAVNITNGLTLNASITNVACNGGSNGTATITPAGGTPTYTYAWSNGQTTGTLTGASAATYTVTVHDAGGCSGTASEAVTQPTALNISVTPVNASCGSNSGSATAAVTGGTSAYQYAWSNSATTVSVASLAPNTYTLTVTDAHSCTATAQAVIVNSGSLSLAPVSSPAACFGTATGSAHVNVTGGSGNITYTWSNGGTGDTITNVPSGTYTVTVSSGSGCSGTSSVSVSQPTALNVSVTSTNSGCGAPNGAATATASGGTSTYTYLWSNAATTASISNLAGATYTLTVTDNHQCSVTSQAVIANSGSLNISTTTTAAGCAGGPSGSATVAVSGGASPFTYLWSNGGTNATISNVTAATYQVTVSDNLSCTGTAAAVVSTGTPLSITAVTNDVKCFNDVNGMAVVSVSSGTAPYQYAWNNGSTTDTITGLVAGSYYITVTDAHNCQKTDTVIINQPADITLIVVIGQPSCSGLNDGDAEAHTTGGTPAYSYIWSTGSNSISIQGLSPGNYAVTLTDNNLCSATSSFLITDPTPITTTSNTVDNACYGNANGSIALNPAGGTAPYTYLWTTGNTSAAISGLAAGTYNVTITDNVNCTATSSVQINQPAALTVTTAATQATQGQFNGSATVSNITGGTPPYSEAWSNGQTSNTVTGLAAGNYTVTVTDNNGCQLVDTVVVGTSVGIETVVNTLSFSIYPNPAKNAVTIDAGTLDKETILMVEDILGQSMMTKNITTSPLTIDLSAYPNGVYFIELRQGDRKALKKLVVNR